MKEKTLGQLEMEVLRLFWDKPGCTFPEAAEVLTAQHGYARTTILTVIQRLHKKGFLERKKESGVFGYYPAEKKATVLGDLARQFVDNMFGGSSVALVQHLTSGKVSPDELLGIKQIIDNAINSEGKETK